MFLEEIPDTALSSPPHHVSLTAARLPLERTEQAYLLNALVGQSHDPILLVESDSADPFASRVFYANPAFREWNRGRDIRGWRLEQMPAPLGEALADSRLRARVLGALRAGRTVCDEALTGLRDGAEWLATLDILPLSALPAQHQRRWMITLRDQTESRRVEAALRESQDKYRMVAGSMADIVSLLDPNGTYLYVTPSVVRVAGYTAEELVGTNAYDYFHPDDRKRIVDDKDRRFLDHDTSVIEWRRRCKSGAYLWTETRTTKITDFQGKPLHLVCSSHDITERKKAETALLEERTLLRTLVDSLPDYIYVKDHQGRYLLNNEAHRQFLGVEARGALGKTVLDFFAPEVAQPYHGVDMRVIATGEPLLSHEESISDRRGNQLWVSTSKIPLLGGQGQTLGLVGISRDITERKKWEDTLQQTAQRYRLLFQSNPQPMWVYDSKTLAFLSVNDTAIALYGYSRAEFLTMTLADIRPPEDMPLLMQDLAFKADGTQVTGPWRHLRKDGSQMWVEIHSHALSFNGRAARLVVSNDITERRALEADRENLLSQTKHLLSEAVERADRDPLTGLLNHRAFHKRLAEEADRAGRQNIPLAIAVMDMDNFKFFNDAYGHSVGDDVLRQVASAMQKVCRSYDTLARFGGDEFALLMPGTDAEGAVRLADRLVAGLEGVGYRPPGYDVIIPLSLSIGIAIFPDDGPGRLEALAAADSRLLAVKSGGTGHGALTERMRSQLSCTMANFSMLNALVTAVDNKDRYTRRHSEDVMSYSYQIAQELGMDEITQHHVLVAALLHDVGKIGVPDQILRKPGKLTEDEFQAIQQHPMMGAVIVGAVPGFEEALDAIRHHHERWDGSGYPFGLAGEETPQMARLMAVADAFSAMTTDRPYRKGRSEGEALAVLRAGAGQQWDPACVEAFLRARRKFDGLHTEIEPS